MTKQRLEAFSDGVIAIIITIMVLELKVPHGGDWHALASIAPKFWPYALSFVFVGIYWNNHHHLYSLCKRVNGRILWANLHLLFWLSLVPVTTGWIGEHIEPVPAAVYGAVLAMCAVAWLIMQTTMLAHHGPDSALAAALGGDVKGKLSFVGYLVAIPMAFVNPWISIALYIAIALVWFIPDRRIESRVHEVAE
jgi:TMEM175 potassium channel family protein